MTPLDLSMFGTDTWWMVLGKALFAFVLLLVLTLWVIVFERQVVGRMQHRVGPVLTGPGGALQSLADGMKLMFKEDFTPKAADKLIFGLAPFVIAIPAITAFSVIPFAGRVPLPFGYETNLQVTDLPVSVLFIVAIASVGAYGIVLAGWSSGSTYPLLGGLRSTAQVISYEVAMGLSLVAVFLYAGSMSTSEIVAAQMVPVNFFGLEFPLWYAVLLLPSFLIYMVSVVGETNRAPFDLPEAEGELVAGFATEYNAMRYAMFFMAEYMNMITVSALATTMFLGGWHAPLPFNLIPGADAGWLGLVWFFLKTAGFLFFFVWLRGTLPRFRYDQFMKLGWKLLIPLSLAWIVAVAAIRVANNPDSEAGALPWFIVGSVFAIVLVVVYLMGKREDDQERATREYRELRRKRKFDAFAGGYPVPPMKGQSIPELSSVVSSTEDDDDDFDDDDDIDPDDDDDPDDQNDDAAAEAQLVGEEKS